MRVVLAAIIVNRFEQFWFFNSDTFKVHRSVYDSYNTYKINETNYHFVHLLCDIENQNMKTNVIYMKRLLKLTKLVVK